MVRKSKVYENVRRPNNRQPNIPTNKLSTKKIRDASNLNEGITNFYEYAKSEKAYNPNYKNHLINIPFRMGIIGSSGSGKTNVLLEIIRRMNDTFEEIIICLRSKNEPLYLMLEEKSKGMVKFYENEIPNVEDFKDGKQRLVVFDDLILDKRLNVIIGEYMIRARKYNISSIYISQSFYMIPKIIRQQFNYLILKKLGNLKDIKMIVKDYSLGLKTDDLMEIYKECTKNKFDFMMLDLENQDYKYRWNFSVIDI